MARIIFSLYKKYKILFMLEKLLFSLLMLSLIASCAKQNDSVIEKGNFKEFKITAKQFAFEPETIEVNKGDKVRLIVTSVDVPHGIGIPEYGINERVDPGKQVTIEFVADKQGTFTTFCTVFCGSDHSNMKGKLIVK